MVNLRTISLALVLSGCRVVYSCDALVVQPSDAIEQIAPEAFRAGLHYWDKVGCTIRTLDEIDPEFKNRVLGPVLTVDDVFHHGESNIEGTYYWNGGISVAIGVFKYPMYGATVVAHEVGHAIGLDHIEGPDNVMFWAPPALSELGPGDISEWYRTVGFHVDVR